MPCCFEAEAYVAAGDYDGLPTEGVGGVGECGPLGFEEGL